MDYGSQCGGVDIKGEVYVQKGDTLHLRLNNMSGRLTGHQIFDDGKKPGIREWFNVDNRPGPDIPESKKNHSVPLSPRKPDRLLLTGLYYRRVHPNQPPLYWSFDWLTFTKNAQGTVTWQENSAVRCDKEPYFEDHDWRMALTLVLTVSWNQPKSKGHLFPVGQWYSKGSKARSLRK